LHIRGRQDEKKGPIRRWGPYRRSRQKWGREQGRRICRSAMDLGSREEEMILSPLPRCGVRREEEIGARLSDDPYMNSTCLVDNPDADMSAMRFCGGLLCGRAFAPFGRRARSSGRRLMPTGGQKKGPARGESGALRGTDQGSVRRERSGRKGGRRNTRCDERRYRGHPAGRQPDSRYVSHALCACEKIFSSKIRVPLRTATGCHRGQKSKAASRTLRMV